MSDTGASTAYEPEPEPNVNTNGKITVFVTFGERSVPFSLKKSHPMHKLFKAAEKAFQMEPNTLKYMYHGDRLLPENTAGEMEMEDQDEISAFVEQLGGARTL